MCLLIILSGKGALCATGTNVDRNYIFEFELLPSNQYTLYNRYVHM